MSELDSLEYSVDVLGQPEPIFSPEELNVKKYLRTALALILTALPRAYKYFGSRNKADTSR